MHAMPHALPRLRPAAENQDAEPELDAPVTSPFLRHRELRDQDDADCSANVARDDDKSNAPIRTSSPENEQSDGSKPEAREKLLFLDGMRGLAAMLVVSHHEGYLEGRTTGGVAVHTFFVLSAFLLTMLFERKCLTLYKQRASRKRWLYALVDYAIRRILRVYPLVIVIALYLACVSEEHRIQWYLFRSDRYRDNYSFFKVLVWAEGHHFFVFWTLPCELLYYLCIPVFVAVTVGLRRWWWVPLIPVTAWIIYSGLYAFVNHGSSFSHHVPEFLAGSVGAVVLNRATTWIKQTNFEFKLWQRLLLRLFETIVLLVFFSVVFDALLFDPKWLGPYPYSIPKSDHFVCVYVTVLIVCETILPTGSGTKHCIDLVASVGSECVSDDLCGVVHITCNVPWAGKPHFNLRK